MTTIEEDRTYPGSVAAPQYLAWTPAVAGALIATALSTVLVAFGTAIGLGVASSAPTWRWGVRRLDGSGSLPPATAAARLRTAAIWCNWRAELPDWQVQTQNAASTTSSPVPRPRFPVRGAAPSSRHFRSQLQSCLEPSWRGSRPARAAAIATARSRAGWQNLL